VIYLPEDHEDAGTFASVIRPSYDLRHVKSGTFDCPPGSDGGDGQIDEVLLSRIRCEVISAGRFQFEPAWVLPKRTLTNFVAFTILEGRLTLRAGETTYALRPDNLLVVPSNVPHQAWNDPQLPAAFCTAHFVPRVDHMVQVVGETALIEPGEHLWQRIVSAAMRVVDEVVDREPGYALAATASCEELFALIIRATSGSVPAPFRVGGLSRIGPALELVRTRYADRLTLRDLADAAHLSPSQFAAIFHRATGVSPIRYVTAFRLRIVRELLLRTDHSVNEIATMTGFSDPTYLSRAFRRSEGATISDFRESGGRGAEP
jgi:AraC-like DNA-binding protein/quercetin dioxygenase-like cupin family protein